MGLPTSRFVRGERIADGVYCSRHEDEGKLADGVRIAAQAERFVSLFSADYYVDRQTVVNAIAQRSMFNLIHNVTIIKIDCIVLKSDAYRQEEFARRKQIGLGDFQTWIVSREDLILSKLHWAKDSKSELQLRDVKNLLGPDCDTVYLRSRAERLGLDELLTEVLSRDE